MDRGEPTSSSGRNDINATVPNEFAYLPNEIIHDVVDSHGAVHKTDNFQLDKLTKIDGSWGVVGREQSVYTRQDNWNQLVIFHSKEYDPASRSGNERKISFQEAQNRLICHSVIDDTFRLDRLITVAPNLYDCISFLNEIPGTYDTALCMMGTRFTAIKWHGPDPNSPATPELILACDNCAQTTSNYSNYDVFSILFIKARETFPRKSEFQLKMDRGEPTSSSGQSDSEATMPDDFSLLDIYGVKVENRILDDLFISFVKKPCFEELCTGDFCHLPFQVIESAYNAWKAPKLYEFKKRAIYARISTAHVEILEDFKTKNNFALIINDCPFISQHPVQRGAKVCLDVCDEIDQLWIRMEIFDL